MVEVMVVEVKGVVTEVGMMGMEVMVEGVMGVVAMALVDVEKVGGEGWVEDQLGVGGKTAEEEEENREKEVVED